MREQPKYLSDCIDMSNPYSEKYVQLVCSEENTGDVVHHIVPVYYFKKVLGMKKVRVKANTKHKCSRDMEPANLASLTDVQHLVAHYYIHKCSVEELQRSADRAFMAMYKVDGKKLLVDKESEYSCLYGEMEMEFNSLIEKYGSRFAEFNYSTKDSDDDDLALINESEFPRVSYSIVLKNKGRLTVKYCARVRQGNRESFTVLYGSKKLSEIWLNRVKCVYEIALDHYLVNGAVPDSIMENVVTVDNLHDIYKKFLPVPLGNTIPKISYVLKQLKGHNGIYYVRINESGQGKARRTWLSLKTKSMLMARKALMRMRRVYDEAVMLDSNGLPVPDELWNMVLRPGNGSVKDFVNPGNADLVNFVSGDNASTYKANNGSSAFIPFKEKRKLMFVVDEWEKSLMNSGHTNKTIRVYMSMPRRFMDLNMPVSRITVDMVLGVVDKIRECGPAWYNNMKIMRLFIKFLANKYALPAAFVEAFHVPKKKPAKAA